jgi:histidinol-phosphate aminotransferase
MIACSGSTALAAESEWAATLAADRSHLVAGLSTVPGVRVAADPASSFVLVRIPGAARVRDALRRRGFAVRRGDTFPGLGPDYVRISVRDRATSDAFLAVLADVLSRHVDEDRGS